MRRLVTLAVVGIVVFLALAPSASAAPVTMAAWTTTPITLGDKVLTLISSTWASNDNISISAISSFHMCMLSPVATASKQLTNTTKSLVYKVTIINDPGTPQDEAVLNWISSVSADGNRYIASGSFTVTGIFDDTSDFSSPLATFSNAGTPTGVLAVAGTVKELYVKLTFAASGGTTLLTSHTVSFTQSSAPVPVESSTWGNVKALYR